jgi:phage host-nuclease inhibitor protein Gam
LPDPQTNGGLLFSVDIKAVDAVIEMLKQNGLENFIEPIGVFVARKEKTIEVKG